MRHSLQDQRSSSRIARSGPSRQKNSDFPDHTSSRAWPPRTLQDAQVGDAVDDDLLDAVGQVLPDVAYGQRILVSRRPESGYRRRCAPRWSI